MSRKVRTNDKLAQHNFSLAKDGWEYTVKLVPMWSKKQYEVRWGGGAPGVRIFTNYDQASQFFLDQIYEALEGERLYSQKPC